MIQIRLTLNSVNGRVATPLLYRWDPNQTPHEETFTTALPSVQPSPPVYNASIGYQSNGVFYDNVQSGTLFSA